MMSIDALRESRDAQRAVTPGQALVLYDGDLVLGGGIILGKKESFVK